MASPLLVIAYALAGTVCIDLDKDPIGTDTNGQPVFLNEIWPSREEIQEAEKQFVLPGMFREVYAKITEGNPKWNSLEVNCINSTDILLCNTIFSYYNTTIESLHFHSAHSHTTLYYTIGTGYIAIPVG